MRLDIHSSDASFKQNVKLDIFFGGRNEFQIHMMDFYRTFELDFKFHKLLAQLQGVMGSVLLKKNWISDIGVLT